MKFKVLFFAVLICAAGSFAALPANLPAGYGLAWSDEFDGTTVNPSNWGYDVGGGGWGNHELETYTAGDNVTVENGCAVISVNSDYTSTRMNTMGKQEFQYGYFEVRIKAPKGEGLWPAFWTLGSDIASDPWPHCGELELYEQRTGQQMVSGEGAAAGIGDNSFISTCHFYCNGATNYNSQQVDFTACLCDSFHTYALLWDSLGITYYFDDQKFWTAPDINQDCNFHSFHQPHFFIANVAIGGDYLSAGGITVDPSIFPQKMYIDYIRVYQLGANGVSYGINKQIQHSLFSLMNPSTAQLKVYNVNGKMIADYTSNVRMMKTGANAIKALPSTLSNGIYIARLIDNGKMFSQRLVIAR